MPEGHTTHRLARAHTDALAGRRVAVSSPQGRFAAGAARLDGQVLDGVEAHGKHLLYRWRSGDVLHVHLGLVGTFRTHHGAAPEPSAQTRLVLASPEAEVAAHLSGPLACELIDPAEEEALLARLGPDPLAEPGAVTAFAERLAATRAPLGQALLDQGVVAGVGNAFRAEALFLEGIDPKRPARDLARAEVSSLWDRLCGLLADGVATGRIHTAPDADSGADESARYVYRRAGSPCRRCSAIIEALPLGGRAMFACPVCQGASGGGDDRPPLG